MVLCQASDIDVKSPARGAIFVNEPGLEIGFLGGFEWEIKRRGQGAGRDVGGHVMLGDGDPGLVGVYFICTGRGVVDGGIEFNGPASKLKAIVSVAFDFECPEAVGFEAPSDV